MALALGKVTILVGAGIFGSVLAKEGGINVSDICSGALKIAFRQLRRDDSSPSTNKPQNDSLMAQVDSLRQELQLLASNKSVMIVTETRSGAKNFGIPVVLVIIVGYGYIWWKGWKLSEMMFVTRRNFRDSCSSVDKQLDQVSSSVSVTKRHLSSRIDRVDCNLEECAEITSATKNEVSELRGDLKVVGVDVEFVHRAVQTLESKIEGIEGKQDITTRGIRALCDFAQNLEQSNTAPSSIQGPTGRALELPQNTPSRAVSLQPNAPSLELPSPSSCIESPKVTRPLQTAVSVPGFKDIQGITDSITSIVSSEIPNGASPAEDPKSSGPSSSSWFPWKFPGRNAAVLSRTHSASPSSYRAILEKQP